MSTSLSTGQLYTVAEVAAMMRVSKMTVYRLVQSGTIQSIRFGRSYRVPQSAVRDYLDSANKGADYSI
ncbi:helix-turn-helix domain-containing protein [Arthrobacter agilis]|uniref:helix-turn-helix domain-containing protein n=1 Tax=Arthrobacter agilis TaxID=37921 RepID=UPI000B357764|nr:helix-turn-helix domain-containing protein [Arthrobacter agilis]OUM43787.1 AlpA family transcriptional regulator [Arthrobacter agilis]PPB46853.1 DNA-binding protein [Arthrobacter agilis]TPV24877.1 helix-turn-helix domain-containing protein [Arthrobacter agilis]